MMIIAAALKFKVTLELCGARIRSTSQALILRLFSGPKKSVNARLDESLHRALQSLGQMPETEVPGATMLDLSAVERELVAAKWRQNGDPRGPQLVSLMDSLKELELESRRLKEEQFCLEFMSIEALGVELSARLGVELTNSLQKNTAAQIRVQQRISQLLDDC